ncbi:MAG: hypothetical protein JXR77_04705, partial [Lentisphaeria bacterium]|nr:hypothetical protein [Lentisphaeria bacterium]
VVPSGELALGEVALRPVLNAGTESARMGNPVRVRVEPPAPPPVSPGGVLGLMPEGIQVTVGDGGHAYAQQAAGDWLKTLGAGRGNAIAIEAWFEVAEPGLGQFQFRGNLPLDGAVVVDGLELDLPQGPGWRSTPISLAAGLHQLCVRTLGVENPTLDIRFGIRGTQTLDGKHFRHR